MVTTKIYKRYQTVVPLEIRKKLDLHVNDTLDWKITEKGTAEIRVKKKKSLKEMSGIYTAKKPFNSVEEAKKIERGE